MPPSSACSQLHSCVRLDDKAVRAGHGRPFEIRLGRFLVGGAHVDPDHVAQFEARIRRELDLLAEAAFGRFRWHLGALAINVVFPAMIRATQPAFLVAPEPQRHAAMGAELVHHADASGGVAERDQPLAEELQSHRRAVRLGDFGRQQRRNPIAPHQRAHRRAGAGQREEIVLFVCGHRPYSRGLPKVAAKIVLLAESVNLRRRIAAIGTPQRSSCAILEPHSGAAP